MPGCWTVDTFHLLHSLSSANHRYLFTNVQMLVFFPYNEPYVDLKQRLPSGFYISPVNGHILYKRWKSRKISSNVAEKVNPILSSIPVFSGSYFSMSANADSISAAINYSLYTSWQHRLRICVLCMCLCVRFLSLCLSECVCFCFTKWQPRPTAAAIYTGLKVLCRNSFCHL